MSWSWHKTSGAGDPWAVSEKHLEADGAWRMSNNVREWVSHVWGIRWLSLKRPGGWQRATWVFPYLWQSEAQSSSRSALEIPGEDDSESSIRSRVIQNTVLVILVSRRYLGKSWLMRKSPRVINDAWVIFFLLCRPHPVSDLSQGLLEAKNVTQQVLT